MIKQSKRILGLFLCFTVLISTISVFNIITVYAFSDTSGHWAETVIDKWNYRGVIAGYEDGTFRPDDSITRAEFTKIIATAKGYTTETAISFSDVSSSDWYYSVLKSAVAAGIITGYVDGTFRPNDQITREEASAIIARAYSLSNSTADIYFVDQDQIGDWALPYIKQLYSNNIIVGYPDGSFMPKSSITRAETVQILDRVDLNASTSDDITSSLVNMLSGGSTGGSSFGSSPGGSSSSNTPTSSTYTVTFDLNYEGATNTPASQRISENSTATEPENPTRDDYVFGGWYKDIALSEPFDFSSDKITSNITLYAKWTAQNDNYIQYENENNICTDENNITYINNEIIVTGNDSCVYSDIELLANKYNGTIVGYIPLSNDYQIIFEDGTDINSIIDSFNSSDLVDEAYLNYVNEYDVDYTYANDPWGGSDWSESNPYGNNWGFEAIKAMSAYNLVDNTAQIKIGLIDSDFDVSHDELKNQFAANGVWDSWGSEALVKMIKEYSESDDEEERNKVVGYKHGTHVAGTMAATSNNSKGLAGICPNNELYGFAMWGNSSNKYKSDMCWKYALSNMITNGVKVINISMSVGNDATIELSQGNNEELENSFRYRADKLTEFLNKFLIRNYDFLIVVGAGNARGKYEFADAKWSFFLNIIDDVNVKKHIMVVGAAENTGNNTYKLADFSNIGDRVDVIAPGVDIYSCVPSGYESGWSGTSMAAPHVSGAAGFIWSINPELSGAEIKKILVDTATTEVSGTDKKMINLYNAAYQVKQSDEDFDETTNAVVMGTVSYSSTGKLIDGAKITFHNLNTNTDVVDETTDGTYSCFIEPGAYTITVEKENYVTLKTQKQIAVGTEYYDVELDAEQCISGRVATLSGQGISDATVAFNINNILMDTVKSDDNGHFDCPLPVGTYDISISKTGYETYNIVNIELTAGLWYMFLDDLILNGMGDQYYVFFDANGGNLSVTNKAVIYGSPYGELPTPARIGYTFAGWYLNGYGEVTADSIFETASNVTLVASWITNNYVVTFNPNGGTVSTKSKVVEYGSTYGTLPTPTRDGYSFVGWYTDTSYTTEVTSNSSVNILADQTLYAKWEEVGLPTTVTISPYTYNQLGQATEVQGTLYSTEGEYLGSSYGFDTWTCTLPSGAVPGYIVFYGYMGNYQVGGLYRFTDNDYAGLKQYYNSQTVSARTTLYIGYKGTYDDFIWTWPDDFDWSLITD